MQVKPLHVKLFWFFMCLVLFWGVGVVWFLVLVIHMTLCLQYQIVVNEVTVISCYLRQKKKKILNCFFLSEYCNFFFFPSLVSVMGTLQLTVLSKRSKGMEVTLQFFSLEKSTTSLISVSSLNRTYFSTYLNWIYYFP